jgi:ABC-type glycerol-3-phosphate transport system substrate-binding protein
MTEKNVTETLPEKSVFSRRTVLKAAGIGTAGISAAAALAACSKKEGAAELDAATVSFVFNGSADQAASWDSLFQGFKTKFPQIDFKANAIPSDSWAA